MPDEHFECDLCGACCKGHKYVEILALDAIREPRLIDDKETTVEWLLDHEEYGCTHLAFNEPCRFLGSDNRCEIHPTRPNNCVGFLPGDEQCQECRGLEGLPPLLPVGKDPMEFERTVQALLFA